MNIISLFRPLCLCSLPSATPPPFLLPANATIKREDWDYSTNDSRDSTHYPKSPKSYSWSGSPRSPSSGLLRQSLDHPRPLLPSPSPPSSLVLVIRTTRRSRTPPQTCYPSRKEDRVQMRLKLTLKTMKSQYGRDCVQEELEKIVSDRGMAHDHVRCRDCKIGRFGFWMFCPDSHHRVDHPYHKCYDYQCP